MSNETQFSKGDRVEANFGRRGWLPGIFQDYETAPDPGEDFLRVHVRMDNGFACMGTGYHPSAVRKAVRS